jgi:hypothetical protein
MTELELSASLRWVGHIARMGDMKNEYKILVENLPKGRYHSENLDANWKIM